MVEVVESQERPIDLIAYPTASLFLKEILTCVVDMTRDSSVCMTLVSVQPKGIEGVLDCCQGSTPAEEASRVQSWPGTQPNQNAKEEVLLGTSGRSRQQQTLCQGACQEIQ